MARARGGSPRTRRHHCTCSACRGSGWPRQPSRLSGWRSHKRSPVRFALVFASASGNGDRHPPRTSGASPHFPAHTRRRVGCPRHAKQVHINGVLYARLDVIRRQRGVVIAKYILEGDVLPHQFQHVLYGDARAHDAGFSEPDVRIDLDTRGHARPPPRGAGPFRGPGEDSILSRGIGRCHFENTGVVNPRPR